MALQMVFRLNVGGSLILPAEDTGFFREWSEDNYYLGAWASIGEVLRNLSLMLNYSKIENYTAPDDVYRSARTSYHLYWELPVDSGFNYLVRLHFCEIDLNISLISQRTFRIDIDYNSAEDDADVIRWTGNRGTPIYKDYVVLSEEEKVEDNNKILPISFWGKDFRNGAILNSAILNGVEVFKLINPEGPEHNLARPSPASSANDPKTNKTIFLAIGSLGFLISGTHFTELHGSTNEIHVLA